MDPHNKEEVEKCAIELYDTYLDTEADMKINISSRQHAVIDVAIKEMVRSPYKMFIHLIIHCISFIENNN